MRYEEISALNWSTLKHLATSAKLLRYRQDNPEPDRDVFRYGRAFHMALLEPEKFARHYICEPDFGDQRYKENKEKKKAWVADVDPTSERLSAKEHYLLLKMTESVRQHPTARELIRAAEPEKILQWVDPSTGIKCKARVDCMGVRVSDAKSTLCTTLTKLSAEAARFLYHGQLAWYHDGAIESGFLAPDAPPPCEIAVQKCEPYDVVVLEMYADDMLRGRSLWHSLIERYADCQAAQWWPGLAPEPVGMNLPKWAPDGSVPLEEW